MFISLMSIFSCLLAKFLITWLCYDCHYYYLCQINTNLKQYTIYLRQILWLFQYNLSWRDCVLFQIHFDLAHITEIFFWGKLSFFLYLCKEIGISNVPIWCILHHLLLKPFYYIDDTYLRASPKLTAINSYRFWYLIMEH